VAAVIRIDAVWLAVEPLDMRAGTETALTRVVRVFGEAQAHHAYLFANRRVTRIKLLVHDGIGIWLCARRLRQGRFIWASPGSPATLTITAEQYWCSVCRGVASVQRRRFASRKTAVAVLAVRCAVAILNACKCTINSTVWMRSNCVPSPPS
jgi:transposase